MSRKHAMTLALHDEHGFLGQEFASIPDWIGRAENTMRVNLCKPENGKTTGWAEITIYKHGVKRTTSASICLNRRQAEALRDLINAAFGGSSRVARSIKGSIYGHHEMAIVEDRTHA